MECRIKNPDYVQSVYNLRQLPMGLLRTGACAAGWESAVSNLRPLRDGLLSLRSHYGYKGVVLWVFNLLTIPATPLS